jgi:hypothetical protein
MGRLPSLLGPGRYTRLPLADTENCALPEVSLNRQRVLQRDRPARDAPREILAFDQFQDEAGDAVYLLETVDSADVGVIQGREGLATNYRSCSTFSR